jgi:hypothetical protein
MRTGVQFLPSVVAFLVKMPIGNAEERTGLMSDLVAVVVEAVMMVRAGGFEPPTPAV